MINKKHLLMNHFKALQQCAITFDAKISLDINSFSVSISSDQGMMHLQPQFISFRDDTKQYITEFDADAEIFAGWRPHPPISLPTFKGKQHFKQYCKNHNLLTPKTWKTSDSTASNFLVKPVISAFSQGIRGPFKHYTDARLESGHQSEYFLEAFIAGQIIKIWIWHKTAICFEIQDMPRIKGDGQRTIENILNQRTFIRNTKINHQELFDTLQYANLDKDSVPENNQLVMVDFRYASPLARRNAITTKVAPFNDSKALAKTLSNLAEKLWPIIEDEHGQPMAYTIDAIVDDQNQLWLLDANSNPMLHPCVYPYMLTEILKPQIKH